MKSVTQRTALSEAKSKLNNRRQMIDRFITLWGGLEGIQGSPKLHAQLYRYRAASRSAFYRYLLLSEVINPNSLPNPYLYEN
jgi:hypothetical protein